MSPPVRNSGEGERNLAAIEEKAWRLLKRCRYEEASSAFQEVAAGLQRREGMSQPSLHAIKRKIATLESLAVCMSRLLDDAGAEAAQREALALRCRVWQTEDGDDVDDDDDDDHSLDASDSTRSVPVAIKGQRKWTAKEVTAAKIAALPCLRNLASFVSNQGRQVDAEMVLRTVLKVLEDESTQQLIDESARQNTGRGTKIASSSSLQFSEIPSKPTVRATENNSSQSGKVSESSSVSESEKTKQKKKKKQNRRKSVNNADHGSATEPLHDSDDFCGGKDGDQKQADDGAVVGGDGFRDGSSANSSSSSSSRSWSPKFVPACSLGTNLSPTTAAAAVPATGRRDDVGSRDEGYSSASRSSYSGDGNCSPMPRRPPPGHPPAPPPPSPCSPTQRPGITRDTGIVDRVGEGRVSSMRHLDEHERGAEAVEELDVVGIEGGKEDPEQTAAVTRHHLAVVLHAQGRTQEAQELLENSVAALKARSPDQAVWIAQSMHDLAGVVRPTDPARACALYRDALDLLEGARGKNHFLTAPTLAKLGSLVGESLVSAAAIPPAPAAPAGPGAAGVARAAGLAEAVCAPGDAATSCDGVSTAAAVTAAAGDALDVKDAEDMIKRAVLIQGRHLGLRHPAVAASMRQMAELYRKQGRLAEAEPLFRKAIGIWENSPGPMDTDAITALHGMAHCVLAGAGADWLGRFEEAFTLVDQAYRIASSQPGGDPDGSYSSSRLLLEALRMIRSRQRQGRGDPQPASATVMDGVWNGRWDPNEWDGGGDAAPAEGRRNSESSVTMTTTSGARKSTGERGHVRASSRADDQRCAVCLEEVGGGDETAEVRSTAAAAAASGADKHLLKPTSSGSSATAPAVRHGDHRESALSLPSPRAGSGDGGGRSDTRASAKGRGGSGGGGGGGGGAVGGGLGEDVPEIKPDIGTMEIVLTDAEDGRARGRLAYLPCGHRFHTHCIGRWLVHSSSCPSCRNRIEDDIADQESTRSTTSSSVSPATEGGDAEQPATVGGGGRRGPEDGGSGSVGDGPAPFC